MMTSPRNPGPRFTAACPLHKTPEPWTARAMDQASDPPSPSTSQREFPLQPSVAFATQRRRRPCLPMANLRTPQSRMLQPPLLGCPHSYRGSGQPGVYPRFARNPQCSARRFFQVATSSNSAPLSVSALGQINPCLPSGYHRATAEDRPLPRALTGAALNVNAHGQINASLPSGYPLTGIQSRATVLPTTDTDSLLAEIRLSQKEAAVGVYPGDGWPRLVR
jgi:hypothetical protein